MRMALYTHKSVARNEDGGWGDTILLGNGRDFGIRHERSTSGPEGRVRLKKDSEVVAVSAKCVLGQEGMQLDLVHRGHHLPRLLQLLQVRDGPVGEADGLEFARLEELFHLSPRLSLIP